MKEEIRCGSRLEDNLPTGISSDDIIRLTGIYKDRAAQFGITDDMLSHMFVIIGAPGGGKTQLMLQMAAQIKKQLTEDDAMIIFDVKRDYHDELAEAGDLVLGAVPKDSAAKQVFWNAFADAQYDTFTRDDVIANLREITTALFQERIRHTTNEYFPNSARALLEAIMLLRMLQAKEAKDYSTLTNKGLLDYQESLQSIEDWKRLAKILRKYGISQAATHLETREAASIISELGSLVGDVFTDQFARKGNFSIRQFTRERRGRTLFVEYNLAKGTTLAPVYSLLFDLALMDTMAHPRKNGRLYLIFDEMSLANFVKKLNSGAAQGRSLNVRMICGIQSITSLRSAFGEDADSIISNISNMVAFRVNDKASRQLIQERCGENLVMRPSTWKNGDYYEELTRAYTVEDWHLLTLDKGDAVVQLSNKLPFQFHFNPYHEAIERMNTK